MEQKTKPLIIAGPCAVESKEQMLELARALKARGLEYIRGGAFKPRTSPESFQGLGEEGLEYLRLAKEETGLKVVTEVVSVEDIEKVAAVADVLQIGSRNMHNYDLLKKIAQRASNLDVLLKRGLSATKKEVLGSIGYLREYGHNGKIIFCERGIRTFADGEYSRFTLDVNFIADLKRDPKFNLEVIVDPSHAAGRNDIVENLAYAGIAAGADGIIVEIKRDSDKPLCDAAQAITLDQLDSMISKVGKIYSVVGGENGTLSVSR